MTPCSRYEVWRCLGHHRTTDTYEYQELIGRDGNTGSAMFLLGRLTGLRQLTPHGPACFNAYGHFKWGIEFLDAWGNMECWCVIEK